MASDKGRHLGNDAECRPARWQECALQSVTMGTRMPLIPSGKGAYGVSHSDIPSPKALDEARPDNLLDSWKEIAAYLDREVRTVQRWEKKEGLPVHRQIHEKLGSVFAYRSEIDDWWRERSAKLTTKGENDELGRSGCNGVSSFLPLWF